jgi:protease PrsW
MSIEVVCPCGKSLKAPDAAAGKQGRCPGCGSVLKIPAVAQPAARPSSAGFKSPQSPANGPSGGPPKGASPSPSVPVPQARAPSREPTRAVAAAVSVTPPTQSVPRPARVIERPASAAVRIPGSSRERLYFVLLLALVPLAISIFDSRFSEKDELIATIREHPEVVEQLKSLPEDADIFSVLPDHRIHNALLPRDSKLHWVFGFATAGASFLLIAAAFPQARANRWPLLGVGLCTATVGVLLLIILQKIAEQAQGATYISLSPVRMIVFYLIKFIGFSYRCADDPANGFLLSFFGYTLGVGLCEEICKCMPLYFRVKNLSSDSRDPANNWRSLCLWGMASGAGFGIAEGIMYAGSAYNGVYPASTYAVRFFSCVALHAIWAGSVGITMYNRRHRIDAAEGGLGVLFQLALAISIAMTLHGLYDTLLKKEMDALALGVAVVSFGWFAYQIESMRRTDPVKMSPRAALAAVS